MEWLTSWSLCGNHSVEMIDPIANIAQCMNCGYVFDNPRPGPVEIASFYSRVDKYENWLAEAKARDAIWKQRLNKMRRHYQPGTLLDVGAGIGQFLHHARAVYAQVYGTEVSESAMRIAKSRYNLDLLQGDLDHVQFEDVTGFDNITLFHVLEHVPHPRQLLQRCHSLLRPGGVLYIAVPNELHSLSARWRRLKMRARQWLGLSLAGYRETGIGTLGISKIRLDNSQFEVHLSHFTPRVLARLLDQCGFRVIESSLDPINLGTGLAFLLHQLYYLAANIVLLTWKANIYDTIWIVAARKTVDK